MTVSIETKVKRIRARRKKWADALRSGDYDQTIGQLQITQAAYDARVAEVKDEYKDYSDEEWAHRDMQRELAAVDPIGHCCLGVAADLAVKGRVIRRAEYDQTAGGVLLEVADWLGLDNQGSGVTYILRDFVRLEFDRGPRPHFICLTELNDEFGYSFTEIADLIEEPGVLKIFVDGEEVIP